MSVTTNRFPASCPDQDTFIPQNLDKMFGVEVKPLDTVSSPPVSTDPAEISSREGLVCLSKAGVGNYLLFTPIAGLPSVGGDDGRQLEIMDVSGHAHTVTTAANKINGSEHVATFGGTIGQSIKLKAYNGLWYANGSAGGVTLS